jgi:hypothetical protein
LLLSEQFVLLGVQRFALAGAELNGAIYAVGGFNGIQYLR